MAPIISLDKDALEELAGVKFSYADINEFVQILSDYAHRFQESLPESPYPIHILNDWIGIENPRRAELDARRAVVDAVAGIWKAARGKGKGLHFDVYKERHSGHLLLLHALFLAVDGEHAPESETLSHDIDFLATGLERPR